MSPEISKHSVNVTIKRPYYHYYRLIHQLLSDRVNFLLQLQPENATTHATFGTMTHYLNNAALTISFTHCNHPIITQDKVITHIFTDNLTNPSLLFRMGTIFPIFTHNVTNRPTSLACLSFIS